MKIVAMLICILAYVSAHAADSHNYAYSWPITTEGSSAAYQVELTPEIYAALTTQDLRDLDVVNAAGDSVPTASYHPFAAAARDQRRAVPMFAIPAPETSAANTEDSIHLHIERGPDGKLRSLDAQVAPASSGAGMAMNEVPALTPSAALSSRFANAPTIVLDASHLREPLSRLKVTWDRHVNAAPRFSVSASEDLQSWRTLVPNATFVQINQDGNELTRNEVPLDGANHNYLMLTRLDSAVALPALTVEIVTPMSAQQPVRHWITASSDGIDPSPPQKSSHTFFHYHLDAPISIDAINVQLADDNSVAHVSVWSKSIFASGTGWSSNIGSIVAFRLRQGDALLVNDSKQGSASARSREWNVELDTPMSHAPTLELGYIPDRFVFLAQGAGPFRLIAGSATMRHGDAPVDVALNQLRASAGNDWTPPLAALGARSDLQGEKALAAEPPPAPQHWKTWLLWTVLVAAAAIVASLALSLLREK
jgi:hypothetical protein